MTCANCERDAIYLVADPGASEVAYCGGCLPQHLKARADDGQFLLPDESKAKAKNKA